MPKLGEVQPKAQARRGGETVNESRSCNGSQQASNPDRSSTATTASSPTAPPSRPSAAATDGCDEHPWLAGLDRRLPRDGSTRPRGPPLALAYQQMRPFSHQLHSLSSGWMDGALSSLSLSSPLLVYLFLLPGHPSHLPHPSNLAVQPSPRNNTAQQLAPPQPPRSGYQLLSSSVLRRAGGPRAPLLPLTRGELPASCHARRRQDQLPRSHICSRPRCRRRAAPARGVRLQERPASSRCCRPSSWAPSGPVAPRRTRPRRRRRRPPTTARSPRRATTARPRSAGASASSRTSTASATSSPATPRHIDALPPPICSCLLTEI